MRRLVPFATGLDDPKGLAVYQDWLFVADKQRIWRIDRKGKAEVFVAASAFPAQPHSLSGLAADPESGILYVSDAGDAQGKSGAIFRVSPQGRVDLVTDAKRLPGLSSPSGLALDGQSHVVFVDSGTGALQRIKLANRGVDEWLEGLGRELRDTPRRAREAGRTAVVVEGGKR